MSRLEHCSLSVLRGALGAAALATERFIASSSWKRFVRVARARDVLRVTASPGPWALRWEFPSAGDDFELFVPGEVAERFYRESRAVMRRGAWPVRLSRDGNTGHIAWHAGSEIAFDLEPVAWPNVDSVFPVDVSPEPAPRTIAVGAGLLARISRAFQRATYRDIPLIWQPTGDARALIALRANTMDISVEVVLMPMRLDAVYPWPVPLPVREAAAPAKEAP